ncbi:iron chelate uptake ABC transporter family permease subunit [uncultured Sphaerochaeta sp.]|uniref:iron chelate uptake ABC transporter family permease subunit n=1 Tax=uncultured Sphaerochaeta sp. TaxID=886478 RepID=UPI0029CA2578|nr:iron chelate uptake ABC transporter family permease subunit [uncultured Sphaerochaeta sp.]
MQHNRKILYLLLLFLGVVLTFLLWEISAETLRFHLPRRGVKLAALCLTGTAIALSTTVFQTVSGNTILTPSILGLDSLYLLIQTMTVFFLGSTGLVMMNRLTDYLISLGVMILFSLLLFSLLLGKKTIGVSLVLLLGMMFGQLFGGISSFFQLLIDPNEFLTVQSRMFASFNMINSSLLGISAIVFGISLCFLLPHMATLDVLSLGKDVSLTLGVSYNRASRLFLVFVAICTALSTALVGPVTFLGLIAVSLGRQISQTYRHSMLFPVTSLLSMTALVGGQFLVERVFHLNTPISVLIHGIGGIYFLVILMKRSNI